MKSVRRVSSLPNSCSCSSCLYRTESERPSLSRIVSQGSKIDKLYYGKYIPLRERKLLEKLIRTRAVYDDIREQLVSSSSTSTRQLHKHKKPKRKNRQMNENKDHNISDLVGLVDKGVLLSPDTSECCSCCSCSSKIKISNEPYIRNNIANHEKRSRTSKSSVISRQRVNDELRDEYNVHFKTKQIKSDPCTCTFKIGKSIKRHSRAVFKKLGSERPRPLVETHREGFEEHHYKDDNLQRSNREQKSRVEKVFRKTINKINSPTKLKGNVETGVQKSTENLKKVNKKSQRKHKKIAQEQQVKIPVTENAALGDTKIPVFKIKKDSVTQFRDKLRKKDELSHWACVETCNEQLCEPEKCLKDIMKKLSLKKLRDAKQVGTHSHKNNTKNKYSNLSKTDSSKAVQIEVEKNLQIQDKKFKKNTKETSTKIEKRDLNKSKEIKPKSKLGLKIQPSVNIAENATSTQGGAAAVPGNNKKNTMEIRTPPQDVTPSVPIVDKNKIADKPSLVHDVLTPISKVDKNKIATKFTLVQDVPETVPSSEKNKSKAVIKSNTLSDENKKNQSSNIREKRVSKRHVDLTKNDQKSNSRIYRRHKQIQSNLTQSKLKTDSQSGHLLKRCFCTLKLKKKNVVQESQIDFTNSKSNSLYSPKRKQKGIHNCDRQICKSGECNSGECKNRIKIHVSKKKLQQKMSKSDIKNEKNISKMNIPLQGIQSQHVGKSGDESITRYSSTSQEQNPQRRQVVRISSTFSFSVEFSKINLSEPQFQQKIETYKKQRLSQNRQSIKQKSTNKKKIKTQHKKSQISNTSKSTKTSMKYGIRRCICTLKINKKEIKLATGNHSKATLTAEKVIKVKHESNNKQQLPLNLKSISATAKLKDTNSKTSKNKWLPYECQPGVCVPGDCDPYMCQEIIKLRERKRLKHHSIKSNTDNKDTKSSLTLTPRHLVSLRTKKVQSVSATNKRIHVKDNVKRSVSVPRHVKEFSREPKQAVRIGSSFSFDIEFFKEKQNSNINIQPLKQHTVSYKHKLPIERRSFKKNGTKDEVKSKNKLTTTENPKKRTISIGPTLKRCFCTLKFQKSPHMKEQSERYVNSVINKSTKDFAQNSHIIQHQKTKYNECEPFTCEPGQCDPHTCLQIKNRNYKPVHKNTGISAKPNLMSVYNAIEKHISNTKNMSISTDNQNEKRATNIKHITKDSTIEPNVPQKIKDIGRSQVKIGSNFSFSIEFHKDKSVEKGPKEHVRILSQTQSQSVTKNLKNEGVQIVKSQNKDAGIATVVKRCFCTLALRKQKGKDKKSVSVLEKTLKKYTVNRVAVESKIISTSIRKSNHNVTEEKIKEIGISEISSSNTTGCLIIPAPTLSKVDISKLSPFLNHSFYSMNVNISTNHIIENSFNRLYEKGVNSCFCTNISQCDRYVEKTNSKMFYMKKLSNTRIHKNMKSDCEFKGENEKVKYPQTYNTGVREQINLDMSDTNIELIVDEHKDKKITYNSKHFLNNVRIPHQNGQTINNSKFAPKPLTVCHNYKKNIDMNEMPKRNNLTYGTKYQGSPRESPSFLKRCLSVLKSLTAKSSCTRTDKIEVKSEAKNESLVNELKLTKSDLKYEWLKVKRKENSSSDYNVSCNKSLLKSSYFSQNNNLVRSILANDSCNRPLTELKNMPSITEENYEFAVPIAPSKRTSSFGLWMQRCFCTLALHKQNIYRNHRYDFRRSHKYSNSIESANDPIGGRKARKLDPYECEPGVCVPGQCDPYECEKRIRRRYKRESGVGTNVVRESSQSTLTAMPRIAKSIKIQSLPKSTKIKRLGEPPPSPKSRTISHTRQGGSESRRAVRIGSKFSFNIEFYKNKGNDNSIKFTKLPKNFRRSVKNTERASVTTKPSHKMIQDFRDARHADTQSEAGQLIKSTMTTGAPFLKRCFCTLKLHQNRTQSFDAYTQVAFPEKAPEVITAEKGTKTKKVKYTPVYNLEPYECEPGVCIPGQCNPYECDKRIQLRRKVQSVSSNTQRNTRSSVSMQYKPNKYRARRSQIHSKYSKRHKQSHVNQVLKTVSERIPNRQAVRIGSNFSFNIEFYKDVPLEQGSVKERRITQDQTQSNMKVKKSPVGGQGINFRHRQSQISGSRVKSRDSGVSPRLKRCFCTLKLHKTGKQQSDRPVMIPKSQTYRSSFTETKKEKICPESCLFNTGTATTGKNIYKLEPYECEPGVCTPGYCDPYECDLRIKRKQMKTMCTETDCPRLRDTGSLAAKSYASKSIKAFDVKQKNAQLSTMRDKPTKYKPPNIVEDTNNSNRQAVRIGSTFSFNIEFFKENDALNPSTANTVNKQEISKPSKPSKTKNKSLSSSMRQAKNQFSEKKCPQRCQTTQAETAQMQSRGSGMPPLLKRCFCTLALHKKHVETSRAEQTQINEEPETAPQLLFSRSTLTKNKYFPHDLKPYECEPGTCEPGYCNPYECEKRIQARNAKYSEIGTHPRPAQYSSMSSMTKDSGIPRKCRNVQCKGKERTSATASPRRKYRAPAVTERAPVVPVITSNNRQVVKIGSSFKFDVEFFKDKSSAERKRTPRVRDRSLDKSYKSGECNTKCQAIKNVNTQPYGMTASESQVDIVKTDNKGSYVENVLKRCFCTMALHKNDNVHNNQKNTFGGQQYQVYYQFKSSKIKGEQKLNESSKNCPCLKKEALNKNDKTVATNTSQKYFKTKLKETKHNPLEFSLVKSAVDQKKNNMETILPYKPRKFNKKTSKNMIINNKSQNTPPENKLEVSGGKIHKRISKIKKKLDKKKEDKNNLRSTSRVDATGKLTGTFDSKLFHGKIEVKPVTKLAFENKITKNSDCSGCTLQSKKPLTSILKCSKSLGRGMYKNRGDVKSSQNLKVLVKDKLNQDLGVTKQHINFKYGGPKPIISRAILKLYTHEVTSQSRTNIDVEDEDKHKTKKKTPNQKNKMVKFSVDPAKKKKLKKKPKKGKSGKCDSQCNIDSNKIISEIKPKSKTKTNNEGYSKTKNKKNKNSKTNGEALDGSGSETTGGTTGNNVTSQEKGGTSPAAKAAAESKKSKRAKSINVCDCGQFKDDMICTCFSSNCECAKAIKLAKKKEKEMKIKRKKLQKKLKRHRQELKQKEKELKKKREQLEIRKKRYKKEDIARQKQRRNSEKYLDKRIRKLKDTSDILLAADSLMDIAKLGFSVVHDVGRSTCRAISDPCYAYDGIKSTVKHPTRIFSILKNAILNSGAIATLKRVLRRFKAMEIVNSATDRLNDYGVTSYIMGMAEKDPVKRLKRKNKKRVQPRRDKDFACNLYMNSLRKKPYLGVYYACPWFYPHFMTMLNAVRQITDLLLFLLAVFVWSPCILCTELCRAMLCCFVCTG